MRTNITSAATAQDTFSQSPLFSSSLQLEKMFFCSHCNGRTERRRRNAIEDMYPVCLDDDSLTEGMSLSSSSSSGSTDADGCSFDGFANTTAEVAKDPLGEIDAVRVEDLNEKEIVAWLEELAHIKGNSTIGSLEIRGSRLCLLGAEAVKNLLLSPHVLHDFTFCLNRVSEEGMSMIARGIRENVTLKSLDLSSNSLNDRCVSTICSALAFHRSVERLCLDFNDFGCSGVEAIAAMLSQNSTIKELHLFGNRIDAQGARCLSGALAQNTSLQRLLLTFNQIGDDGTAALAEALTVNTTLRKLSIAANNIKIDGLTALGSKLPEMTGIEYLDVGDVYDAEEAEALVVGLEHNTRLVTLHVESPAFGENSTIESRLDFGLRFNKCGHSLMQTSKDVPAGLWLLALAKASTKYRGPNQCPDVLYAMLRQKPELLVF